MLILLSSLGGQQTWAESCGDSEQGPDALDRPKIGLALSGGGARGVAHVGVLDALEKLGVPIDCVAGTSMGAVVGGLYAAGYSPAEIEQQFLTVDWPRIFRGKPLREALSFRRKEDDNRYVFDLEIGFVDGKLATPGGTLSAFGLEFLLQRLTLPALGIDDFDRLPIPFRAVTADLGTGKSVVLGSGDLALAIRASMSIPGIYPPVSIDGQRLIDGGVLDNLPVDVVREMGADIVIAVNVGEPTYPSDQLNSVPAISARALSMASEQAVKEQEERADLLIVPQLAGVSNLDFSALKGTIEAGKEAATFKADELSNFALAGTASVRPALSTAAEDLVITGIRVEGTHRVDRRLITSRIHTPTGEPLDLDLLLADLGRVLQIGEFESVRFALEPSPGATDLIVRVTEKPWGPHYLRFGMSIRDDLEGSNSFGLLVNYTRTSLNALGAEWRNDFRVGETRRLFSEFYQPLDFDGRFFIAGSFESLQDFSDIYSEGRKVAEYEVESNVLSLDVGSQFGKYGELRAGVRWGDGRGKPSAGSSDLPGLDVTIAGLEGRLVIDRLDSSGVPRRGGFGQLKLFRSEPSLGADDSYTRVTGEYARFLTRKRHTFFLGLEGGSALDTQLPVYDQFVLGGLLSFSGFRPDELRGQHFAVARPGYLYRVLDLPPAIGVAMYFGGWLEAGNVWQSRDEIDSRDLAYSFTVAAALDTKVGPIYLGYGYADRGSGYFQLSIGPRF